MWRRLNAEVLVETAAVAVGVLFAVTALPLFQKVAHHDVGPGMFPLLAATAVIICAVLGLVALGMGRRWLAPDPGVDPAGGAKATAAADEPETRAVRVLWLVLGVAAYIVGAERLGFTVATLGFMAFACRLFGARDWLRIGAVSVGLTVLTYLLFVRGLEVALPQGMLGF